jgi:hypothetical protein
MGSERAAHAFLDAVGLFATGKLKNPLVTRRRWARPIVGLDSSDNLGDDDDGWSTALSNTDTIPQTPHRMQAMASSFSLCARWQQV